MYKSRKNKIVKNIEIIGICVIILLFTGCNNAADRYVKKQKDTVQIEKTDVFAEKNTGEQEDGDTTLKVMENDDGAPRIYVQVSGAVVNPGVYQLEEGSRIFQAVELAGGMTEAADINSINQAQVLSDGQMIYVYAQGESLQPAIPVGQQEIEQSQSSSEDGKVNLNTATAEELQTLPGIGQSKADMIISYREEHGPFESIEGLMNIPGIKEGVFSKIKEHIKVN